MCVYYGLGPQHSNVLYNGMHFFLMKNVHQKTFLSITFHKRKVGYSWFLLDNLRSCSIQVCELQQLLSQITHQKFQSSKETIVCMSSTESIVRKPDLADNVSAMSYKSYMDCNWTTMNGRLAAFVTMVQSIRVYKTSKCYHSE